jgi:hypothetical protein
MTYWIFALATVAQSAPTIPPAFQGNWAVSSVACSDAGQNDTLKIDTNSLAISNVKTSATKVRKIGTGKIVMTGNVSEQDMPAGTAGYVLKLSQKGSALQSTMTSENGQAIAMPRAITYRKCT